ncbi:hypothetical protein ACN28S_12040 [Cystobacter fuscus]
MTPAQERLLARSHGLETLESAYDAWSESRRDFLAERAHYQRELERLEQQGSFLVGAVRQASAQQGAPVEPAPVEAAPAGSALVAGEGPLRDFLGQAEQKLARAKEALAREQADSEQRHLSAFEEWRTTVRERVRRHRRGASALAPALAQGGRHARRPPRGARERGHPRAPALPLHRAHPLAPRLSLRRFHG